MRKRVFACFMIFVILFNVHVSSYAQAQLIAKPFTGYINDAIAGTIVKYAIRRGFAANDPRIALTEQAVGKVIDIGVNGGAALDTALVIAGAPVWGTVALTLATAGVVAFGAYKIYKAVATDPATGESVQTVKIIDTSKSTDAQNAPPVALSQADLVSTTANAKVSTTTATATTLKMVSYRNPTCNVAVNSSCGAYPVAPPSRYFYAMDSLSGFPLNTAADYLFMELVLICGAGPGCTSSWDVAPSINTNGVLSGTYKITYPQKDSSGNPTGTYGSTGSAMSISPRTDSGALGAYYGNTLGDALEQLPSGAVSAVMTPAAMADIVSNAIVQAASVDGYQGLPYSVTAPVTADDVAAWQAEAPSRSLPLVAFEAAVEPVGATAVTIAPNVSATNPYAVDTSVLTPPSNVNVLNTPNVNVVNKVTVDLGNDPGVALPELETAPTTESILDPIFNLFPTLRNFKMPQHQGVCPKADLSLFGGTQSFSAHCDLLESQRALISTVMAFVWAFVALRVALSA